jgi:nitrogen fixation NifU-like protein
MRATRWSKIMTPEQKETNDFDRWVAALQEAILERERALFSVRVLAEARQPQNMGVMDDPDGYGLVFGSCGDTMEVFLRLSGERIEKVAFVTDGCGPTVACGSMLTRMAQGKSLAEAAAIEAADVITALDGLPAEHVHCATLAADTLHQAIAECCPEAGGGGE